MQQAFSFLCLALSQPGWISSLQVHKTCFGKFYELQQGGSKCFFIASNSFNQNCMGYQNCFGIFLGLSVFFLIFPCKEQVLFYGRTRQCCIMSVISFYFLTIFYCVTLFFFLGQLLLFGSIRRSNVSVEQTSIWSSVQTTSAKCGWTKSPQKTSK